MAKVGQEKMYFFFDEIQLVAEWEYLINSLRVDVNADIYLTGSNSSILSGELATLLTGRYYQVKVYPFSFAEYLELKEIDAADSGKVAQSFREYALEGGMSSVIGQSIPETLKLEQLSNLYDSIMLRDVAQRSGGGNQQLVRMLTMVLLDSITSEVNVSKLTNRLKNAGFNITTSRFREYVRLLEDAFLFHRVIQLNLRGAQRLRANDKFYVADNGLWYAQVGGANSDIGKLLDNIVCLELCRRGYDIHFGVIDGVEIDFVAEKAGQRLYIQVAQELPADSTRETDNLLKIPDKYPKLLITGSDTGVREINSIPVMPIYDWLLGEVSD
jgi:predicted AAA+ superfamily ATPase